MPSVSRAALALLLALCLPIAGCDAVFVGFVSNPGASHTVSGTVSIVQLNYLHDVTGNIIMFTAVTFLNFGTATTVNFCGDQRGSFPMNRNVRADFNTGTFCSTLVVVVIISAS